MNFDSDTNVVEGGRAPARWAFRRPVRPPPLHTCAAWATCSKIGRPHDAPAATHRQAPARKLALVTMLVLALLFTGALAVGEDAHQGTNRERRSSAAT